MRLMTSRSESLESKILLYYQFTPIADPQAVMLWQSMNNVDPQHMSIGTDGQIVMKSKQELKQQFVAEPLAKLKPQ